MGIPRRPALPQDAPAYAPLPRAMGAREAMFAPRRTLPVGACEGRVLAAPAASCPPAVPIVMPGERITRAAVERFMYYGIGECEVVADQPGRP